MQTGAGLPATLLGPPAKNVAAGPCDHLRLPSRLKVDSLQSLAGLISEPAFSFIDLQRPHLLRPASQRFSVTAAMRRRDAVAGSPDEFNYLSMHFLPFFVVVQSANARTGATRHLVEPLRNATAHIISSLVLSGT
jgi:hypothetical protein